MTPPSCDRRDPAGNRGPQPDPERQGPATLIAAGDQLLLFDAGRGVATQLVTARRAPTELDALFLTHLHLDHIGSPGDLLMATWNLHRRRPLPVYGPPGTAEVIDAIFGAVYRADIAFGNLQGEGRGYLHGGIGRGNGISSNWFLDRSCPEHSDEKSR